MIGLLGDIHGRYSALRDRMRLHPEIKEWLQVGDLGGEDLTYESTPSSLTFISGNHENWDGVARMHREKWPENVTHINNGSMVTIEGLNILGFGGNYSSKFFGYPKDKLPQSRRRHFVQEEFLNAIKLGTENKIDILITHEAPAPYKKEWGGVSSEMGIELITELSEAVKPRYHFFGHHHYRSERTGAFTTTIGLEYGCKGFYKVCPESLSLCYIDSADNINRI